MPPNLQKKGGAKCTSFNIPYYKLLQRTFAINQIN